MEAGAAVTQGTVLLGSNGLEPVEINIRTWYSACASITRTRVSDVPALAGSEMTTRQAASPAPPDGWASETFCSRGRCGPNLSPWCHCPVGDTAVREG